MPPPMSMARIDPALPSRSEKSMVRVPKAGRLPIPMWLAVSCLLARIVHESTSPDREGGHASGQAQGFASKPYLNRVSQGELVLSVSKENSSMP